MIQVLWDAHKITPADVHNYLNTSKQFPSLSESELLVRLGFVSERELKSLQLANQLLSAAEQETRSCKD